MNIEILVSLHRHWVWADRMKELFEYYLKEEGVPSKESLLSDQPYMVSSMFTCMCLWYGVLYVVCDGIEKIGRAEMSEIAPVFNKARKMLYGFRNAMFHAQPKYWSTELVSVLHNERIAETIRATHVAVGAWLEEQLKPYAEAPNDSTYLIGKEPRLPPVALVFDEEKNA